MRLKERWKEIGASALGFAVFFAILTALRVWNLEPATSIQSAIVNGIALLGIAVVAYYGYSGGDFLEGWILAFGVTLAFTLNLFAPIITIGILEKILWALGSTIPISGVIAAIGYLLGKGLRRVTGAHGALHPS